MLRVSGNGISIGEVAPRRTICIHPDTTIQAASELMRLYQTGELVLADRPQGVLVPLGIISARDIVTRILATGLDPSVMTAGDIAWTECTGVKVTDSISDTLKLLRTTHSNVLPVTQSDGELAGLVSVDDLLWALAKD